jgi:hypothetical protein
MSTSLNESLARIHREELLRMAADHRLAALGRPKARLPRWLHWRRMVLPMRRPVRIAAAG